MRTLILLVSVSICSFAQPPLAPVLERFPVFSESIGNQAGTERAAKPGAKAVEAMFASSGHLIFLMNSNRSTNASRLVITDEHGSKLAATELDDGYVSDLATEPNGNILVLSALGDQELVEEFDSFGSPLSKRAIRGNLTNLVVLAGQAFGITRLGDVVDLYSSDVSAVQHLPVTDLALGSVMPIGKNQLAVVDPVDASIITADISGGSPSQNVITQLDVLRVLNLYQKDKAKHPGIRALTVVASATANSDIYLLLSMFRARDGAPIAIVNGRGEERKRTIRVPMIYSVGAHAAGPVAIAVTNDKLFVVDTDGVVSVYKP